MAAVWTGQDKESASWGGLFGLVQARPHVHVYMAVSLFVLRFSRHIFSERVGKGGSEY
jgi:hypothetical protein